MIVGLKAKKMKMNLKMIQIMNPIAIITGMEIYKKIIKCLKDMNVYVKHAMEIF